MSLTKRNRRFVRGTHVRQLRLEPLEDRRLLAVITVNSSADDLIADGMVTLREAIQAANTDASVDGSTAGSGADTIEFDGALSGQTITLGGTHLEITEALTIDATALVQNVTVNANNTSRIFNITASTGDFTLAGLTLSGGRTIGDNANTNITTFSGAAVRSLTTGSLTIDQSTVSGNSTTGTYASGGAIHSRGVITLTSSTVSGNSTAGDFAKGGGIRSSGAVTLTNSTVSGNSTAGFIATGGGIYSFGALTLTNSTVSGNSATGSYGYGAGAITFGDVTIVSSTVSNNHAYDSNATGGGIWNNNDVIDITNSIVAGNTAGGGSPDIVPGSGPLASFSVNFSLIGTGVVPDAGTSGNNVVTNNPLIGPLTDNGGPTETHALLAGSLAIDAGDPSIAFNPTDFDQRGAPHVRVYDDDLSTPGPGPVIDMGAFELQPPFPAQGLVVDTITDIFNSLFTIGDLSLREAVFLANINPLANTITFDPSLSGQTITLLGTDLEITQSLTIDATSLAQNVTVDANNASRIFDITVATGDFTIAGLTLTGGHTSASFLSGRGGAVRSLSNGTLTIDQSTISGSRTFGVEAKGGGISSVGPITLTDSTVSGNSTVGNNADGGGIHSSGNVTLTQSTVSGNSTSNDDGRGGGIFSGGALTLTRSTVSGNSTAGDGADGGGIFSGGALTLTSSTVSGNSTTGLSVGGGILSLSPIILTQSTVTANHAFDTLATGGGIWNSNDLITITNSIVAGNTAGVSMNDIDPGTGTLSIDYSLIEDIAGLTIAGSNNITGMSANLGLLAKTSGPTKTHRLLPDSPAIDAGDPNILFDANEFDQRGAPFARVYDDPVAAGTGIDMGATERQTLPRINLVVDTLVDENDGDFTTGDLSLREAVGLANGSVGANTVTFDAAVFATPQTILLYLGEIEISEAITIDATAVANVTIDAQQQSRIFNIVVTTGDFTLAGLSLTGGRTIGDNVNLGETTFSGGAIRSFTTGSLTIDQSTVSGNSTTGDSASGGGIFSYGPVSITQSTVSGNSTGVFGGGGGGIFSTGTVTLTDTTVSGNSTGSGGGSGGGIFSIGDVTLTGSTVSGNSTAGSGGGIFSTDTITLTGSTVSGNSTGGNGGGIASFLVILTDSTVSENSTTGEEANGGGISASFSATLTNSTVSGNSTSGRHAKGGGIYSRLSGPVTLTGSTVSGNSTLEEFAHGGGIYSYGPVTLTNSTVSENNSSVFKSSGGGIYSLSIVTLTHSTVTANHAATGYGSGGGIFSARDIAIANSIVAGNTARDMNDIVSGIGSLTIAFSLIGDNDGTGLTEAPVGSPDTNGNLIGGSINGIIDPLLDPLADNGGPTETHALLVGSSAIDAGDPTAIAGVGGVPMFDQRGMPFGRVEDGDGNMVARIDMGAYEVQPPTVPTCDSDGMNGCSIDDIDAMVMEIVAGTNSPLYDLTDDGLVNLADRDQWLADAGALNLTSGNPYLLGDSNLDGVVDGQDFIVWNANKFMSTGKWSQADWNADGVTDGQDFIIWNGNKFQSSAGLLRSVLPSTSHPSYEIAPSMDLQTREQSTTRLLGISQIIPSTNTKRIDAVFAGFHQRQERDDEQRQADIFDALIEDFPMKSYLL